MTFVSPSRGPAEALGEGVVDAAGVGSSGLSSRDVVNQPYVAPIKRPTTPMMTRVRTERFFSDPA